VRPASGPGVLFVFVEVNEGIATDPDSLNVIMATDFD
jgi:hypothetical protein